MCLNCGCMRAHDDMGMPGTNITYEDVKRAADANGKTIDETLETIARNSRQGSARPSKRVCRGRDAGLGALFVQHAHVLRAQLLEPDEKSMGFLRAGVSRVELAFDRAPLRQDLLQIVRRGHALDRRDVRRRSPGKPISE